MELLISISWKVFYALCMIGVVMGGSAYAVLAERKVASWIQERPGPNRTAVPFVHYIPVIGPLLIRLGLMQPVADGLKFFFKEEIIPGHVNKLYYHLAPCIVFIPAMLTMTVMPVGMFNGTPIMLADIDLGILLIFAISSLGVYGVILAGWSSNSKYPFIGGVRGSAQMISYELALGLSVLTVFMWVNDPGQYHGFSLVNVVEHQNKFWFIMLQPLQALIFLVALFAETNRLPFDMPEAETELVSGYNTEYGCFKFGLFFVAEYAHIIIGSAVFTVLFLGGWDGLPFFEPGYPQVGIDLLPWYDLPAGLLPAVLSVLVFLIKVFFLVIFFMWVRWTLPRFRYDQVMMLGWKVLLPLSLALLVIYSFGIAFLEEFGLMSIFQ